jgi:hypothetical protein
VTVIEGSVDKCLNPALAGQASIYEKNSQGKPVSLNFYKKGGKQKNLFFTLVVPPGIEPGTHGFSVRCSTY